MLQDIFKAILITSFIGTALTLILTLFKPITKKWFSSGWHYYMWLIVLVAMILPVKITIPEKVEPVPTSEIISQMPAEQTLNNIQPPILILEQEIELEKGQENITYSRLDALKSFAENKITIISLVWFLGMIILFMWKIAGYIVFLLKLRKYSDVVSCPELMQFTNRKITTRISDKISSPLMIGLFKPTLLLPKTAMTPEQLDNVLAHEMTHFERKDILY